MRSPLFSGQCLSISFANAFELGAKAPMVVGFFMKALKKERDIPSNIGVFVFSQT
jgi:hypothetical protein